MEPGGAQPFLVACIASRASCMYVKLQTLGLGYAANSILAFSSISEPVF